MKLKIRLDTMQDINDFIDIAETISKNIYLVNGDGDFKVPIRSRLGAIAIANLHFDDLWVESDVDLSPKILKWIV